MELEAARVILAEVYGDNLSEVGDDREPFPGQGWGRELFPRDWTMAAGALGGGMWPINIIKQEFSF